MVMSWDNTLSAIALLEKNSTVKKHIATVHVEARLSLLEEKIFNVLLLNAYPSLLKQSKHSMKYSALCELIGYSSGDRESIKKALRKIATIQIEWIGKNDKGREISWEVYNYLSSAAIHFGSDSFDYGFDPTLAEHLYNPEVFAKISLVAQRQFSSKYSLYLYENCARYRKTDKFQGLTPKWDIQLFRQLMGVHEVALYDRFSEINRRILKVAIQEINTVSDIYLDLEIFKEGRKVSALQFQVSDNPNQVQMQLPGVKDEMDIKNVAENPVVQKCVKMGVGEGIAIQWLKTYGEAYILEKVLMAEKQIRSNKIHSSAGGWLIRAVKNDYQDEALQLETQRKEKREQARQQREAEVMASEALIAKQRAERFELRQKISRYIASLDLIDFEQFEVDFTRETQIEPSDTEAFHDWIAEKLELGNPYPALRAKRLQRQLSNHMSL